MIFNEFPSLNNNKLLITNIVIHLTLMILFKKRGTVSIILLLNCILMIILEILFKIINNISLSENANFNVIKYLISIPFVNIILVNIYQVLNYPQEMTHEDEDEDEDENENENENYKKNEQENEDEDENYNKNEMLIVDENHNLDENEDKDKDKDEDEDEDKDEDENYNEDKPGSLDLITKIFIDKKYYHQKNTDDTSEDDMINISQDYLEKYAEYIILNFKSSICLRDEDVIEIQQFIGNKLSKRDFRMLIRKINMIIRNKIHNYYK